MDSEDELEDEFRKAVADATPLRRKARAQLKAPAPLPVARQRGLDEAAVLAESLDGWSAEDVLDTEEDLSFLRDGMSAQVLRKLCRGHWAVEDSVDLHGLTREQAGQVVVRFLNQCNARGLRCVRIVHGKGLGILRASLKKWLPKREEVLAYCQAPANDGGSGALLVLLKAKR
jgi:DNA-nicking Smr family endonuclease